MKLLWFQLSIRERPREPKRLRVFTTLPIVPPERDQHPVLVPRLHRAQTHTLAHDSRRRQRGCPLFIVTFFIITTRTRTPLHRVQVEHRARRVIHAASPVTPAHDAPVPVHDDDAGVPRAWVRRWTPDDAREVPPPPARHGDEPNVAEAPVRRAGAAKHEHAVIPERARDVLRPRGWNDRSVPLV